MVKEFDSPSTVIERQHNKDIGKLGSMYRSLLRRFDSCHEVLEGIRPVTIVEMTTAGLMLRYEPGAIKLQTVREENGVVTIRKIRIVDFHKIPYHLRHGANRSVSYAEYPLQDLDTNNPIVPGVIVKEPDLEVAKEKAYAELGHMEAARIRNTISVPLSDHPEGNL